MKKQLMRFVHAGVPSTFFKASAIVILLAGASYTTIQAAPASYSVVNPDPGVKDAVIKHIGSTNETLLFEVKVANESGERFTILIKDDLGTTLYRGVYSDKNFSKKFQFPKADSDKIIFVVKSASGNKTESFEINSNTRVVEEVIVKRVG